MNFELIIALTTPLDAGQQQQQHSHSARTLNLPPEHDKEQTLSLTSIKDQWPAEQISRKVRPFAPFVQECVSTATVVRAHSTAILTNRGPCELVAGRIFYTLQIRTRTIIYKKNDRLKIIFRCIQYNNGNFN